MEESRYVYILVSAIVGIGAGLVLAYLKERHSSIIPSCLFNQDRWDTIKANHNSFDARLNTIEKDLSKLGSNFGILVDRRYQSVTVNKERRE